jgi:hypothetical protein
MIPKYLFVVHVEHRPTGPNEQENPNYEALQGASAYASMTLRKQTVRTVTKNVTTESDSVTNTRNADRPHYSRRCSSSTRGVVVGIAFAADPERAAVERDAATLMCGSSD